jgi:hypothetical protein
MMLSDIINLFIGLTLTFASVGLAVSTIVEAIASFLSLRSATLLDGLKSILNDPDLTGLAGAIINHGGANPMGSGTIAADAITKDHAPSYIPPQRFAQALVDILRQPPQPGAAAVALPVAISRLDPQLSTLFSGLYRRSGADAGKFRDEIASWFDNAMDRVSGDYKRQSQWISLLVGLALAIGLNIDSFAVARAIWDNPQMAVTVDLAKEGDTSKSAVAMLTSLKDSGFPFGWKTTPTTNPPSPPLPLGPYLWSWFIQMMGWLITATAALFGAPFWFDLLQRLVQLRGTGAAPDEKKQA